MKQKNKNREKSKQIETAVTSPYTKIRDKFGGNYEIHINRYRNWIFVVSIFIYGSTCYRSVPGGDSSEIIGRVLK